MSPAQVMSAGMGDLTLAQGDGPVLAAAGLGSCIGVAAHEPSRKIAVMAHIMLPDAAPGSADPAQLARHAPQAIAAIVAAVERRGGRCTGLVVKIAGGAHVIRLAGRDVRFKVGQRNVAAGRRALAEHGLRLAGEDTGGIVGRTLSLYAGTGVTTVRVAGGQEQPL